MVGMSRTSRRASSASSDPVLRVGGPRGSTPIVAFFLKPALVSHSRLATQSLLPAVFCLLAACLAGCQGPAPKPTKGDLSAEEFRRLLAAGTVEPVLEMEHEDPFGDLPPEMGEFDEPSDLSVGVDLEAAGEIEPQPDVPENPYLAFGSRIQVNRDGTITKPYPLRVGTGKKMEDLIRSYGNFPLFVPAEGAVPAPDLVKLETLENWDVEFYRDLRDPDPTTPAVSTPLADWLVVTTGQELLYEVESFINLFGAGVPQIEIEAKIVEIGFQDSLDIGVKTDGTPMFDFGGSKFVKSFTSETPNLADVSEALLAIGGVHDGLAFNAILEAVATHDNVSIISRPKIAVREGGRAEITNTQKLPILDITGINPAGGFNAKVSYQEVGVKMYVVPRVVGTDTVALHIDIEASQQSGSEPILLTGANEVVSIPVLSIRRARTIVYLRPGQAVILGGLITERNVEVVRKVPILGDIPVLNLLFRSKFTRKEQANVLFFIRPRILQGADMNREF